MFSTKMNKTKNPKMFNQNPELKKNKSKLNNQYLKENPLPKQIYEKPKTSTEISTNFLIISKNNQIFNINNDLNCFAELKPSWMLAKSNILQDNNANYFNMNNFGKKTSDILIKIPQSSSSSYKINQKTQYILSKSSVNLIPTSQSTINNNFSSSIQYQSHTNKNTNTKSKLIKYNNFQFNTKLLIIILKINQMPNKNNSTSNKYVNKDFKSKIRIAEEFSSHNNFCLLFVSMIKFPEGFLFIDTTANSNTILLKHHHILNIKFSVIHQFRDTNEFCFENQLISTKKETKQMIQTSKKISLETEIDHKVISRMQSVFENNGYFKNIDKVIDLVNYKKFKCQFRDFLNVFPISSKLLKNLFEKNILSINFEYKNLDLKISFTYKLNENTNISELNIKCLISNEYNSFNDNKSKNLCIEDDLNKMRCSDNLKNGINNENNEEIINQFRFDPNFYNCKNSIRKCKSLENNINSGTVNFKRSSSLDNLYKNQYSESLSSLSIYQESDTSLQSSNLINENIFPEQFTEQKQKFSQTKPRPSYIIERDCHIFGGCSDEEALDEFFISSGAVYQSWPYVYEPGYKLTPLVYINTANLSKSDDQINYSINETNENGKNLDENFEYGNNFINEYDELPSYCINNFEINFFHVMDKKKKRKKKKKGKKITSKAVNSNSYIDTNDNLDSPSITNTTSYSSSSYLNSDNENSYYDDSSDDSESIKAYKQRHAIGLNYNINNNYNNNKLNKFNSQMSFSDKYNTDDSSNGSNHRLDYRLTNSFNLKNQNNYFKRIRFLSQKCLLRNDEYQLCNFSSKKTEPNIYLASDQYVF